MFNNYLKITFRNIIKHKGYSLINILGLAVGMICCIVILQYVRHELSYDNYHENSDRIYRLNITADFTGQNVLEAAVSAGPVGPALVEQFPEIEKIVRLDFGYTDLYEQEKKILVKEALYVENTIFDFFDYEFISGDPKSALLEPYTIVVTEETANRLFGNENPIGKIFKTYRDYTITGVIKNLPSNTHIKFDMLISMAEKINNNRDNINVWETFNYRTYLLLNEKADPKALEAKMPAFVKQNFSNINAKLELFLQPLNEIHLYSTSILYDFNHNKSDLSYIYVFSSIAVIILLIACINFMNLSTAHSAKRSMEVGIRKVIGAHRNQLITQFLGESFLISVISAFITLATIELIQPMLLNLFGIKFSHNILTDIPLLLFYIGIVIAVSFMAGSYPAFILSSFQPKETIKGFAKPGGKGEYLRKLLVTTQFIIAIILITGVIFISKQMNYIQSKNLGFNKEQVLYGSLSRSMSQDFEVFRNILMDNPSVIDITSSEFTINEIFSRALYRIAGDDKSVQRMATQMRVDYDFIPFFDLELVEGRNFSRDFPSDKNQLGGYIINETLLKQLGWETAVGKRFGRVDPASDKLDPLGRVIGVMKDFNFESLHDKIGPIYFYMTEDLLYRISIRVRPENIQETLAFIKEKWTAFDPGHPFELTFLDDEYEMLYRNEERVNKIVKTFTGLAVFITCLGLLGLISYSTERRVKEIGIRKTLGAPTISIITLLIKEIGLMVIIANVIALPFAWYVVSNWLQNFSYRIEISSSPFLFAGVAALLIALSTVIWQSIRAATANPIESLKNE